MDPSAIGFHKHKKQKSEATEEQFEHESHFVLRLPLEYADEVHNLLAENPSRLKDILSINISQDMRHAMVKFDRKKMSAKLMDLPTIVESLKTLDGKNFYKVADICQMLICQTEEQKDETKETEIFKSRKKAEKEFQFRHGITPPLKNIRKRRFRKTLRKKYMDAPQLERELKRLLRADLEARSVKWQILTAEDENSHKMKVQLEQQVTMEPPSVTSSQTVSDGQQPSTSTSTLKPIHETEVFGGHVSDSSDEEDVEQMARQLMMTGDATTDQQPTTFSATQLFSTGTTQVECSTSNQLSDGKQSDEVVRLDLELIHLIKQRQELQNQIKTLDNEVLRSRMESDISDLITKETNTRQQLEEAKRNEVSNG